jgi:hypothetical protein
MTPNGGPQARSTRLNNIPTIKTLCHWTLLLVATIAAGCQSGDPATLGAVAPSAPPVSATFGRSASQPSPLPTRSLTPQQRLDVAARLQQEASAATWS